MGLKHWFLAILLTGAWSALTRDAFGQGQTRIGTFPGSSWDIRTPAEVGLDAGTLATLAATVGGSGLIIKDGFQVYNWGPQSVKRDWLSAAKPVTSTLLMFAVDEGLLPSEQTLIGPYVEQDFGQPLRSKDSLTTFFHLAHMTSGYALPSDPGPGTRWGYNDYAIKLYSRLLANQVFGSTLNDAVTHASRLGSLQFQDGTIYSTRQGLGVYTTPRDFARIGWFWLNRGYWNGTQLLPDEAFDTFLSVGVHDNTPQTSGGLDDYLGVGTYGGGTDQTSAGPGVYGFNFWVNTTGLLWPDAPFDTYQANGGWNRDVVTVIPSLKVVAAWMNTGSNDPETFAGPMNSTLKLLADAADIPFSVPPGWSQVSVPVRTADMSVSTLLSDPNAAAFRFTEGQYVSVDSFEVGTGYFVYSGGLTTTLRGEHVLPRSVPLEKGWNLVGVFHNQVTLTEISSEPLGIVDSLVFDVLGDNDPETTVLDPGQAVWVLASEDGHLVYHNEPGPAGKNGKHPLPYRKRRRAISASTQSPHQHVGAVKPGNTIR